MAHLVRSSKTFYGGVHPAEYKGASEHLPIEILPLPHKVVLPLSQHLGAPSAPCVKVSDTVKTGQKIADAAGFISVPLHASITGTVTAIGAFPHPNGRRMEAIVIEGNGTDEKEPAMSMHDPLSLDNSPLKQAVIAAGIVGLGGAAFPTHVKLSPPKEKTLDLLIINGCECEPYLTCDNRIMIEQADRIVEGIRLLKKILCLKKAVVGIENNKPEAAQSLAKASAADPEISVIVIKTKYPQGGEKQLIKSLTGREVPPPPALPMDAGVVVHNVATCIAVRDAVVDGTPCYQRVLTVSGDAIATPKNLLVRNGTLLSDIIAFCGGTAPNLKKVVIGGPMMGIAAVTIDVPVLKATSGLLFLSEKCAISYAESSCIRCGSCVRACPMGLAPSTLCGLVKKRRWDSLKEEGALECIECGSCAYSCPARIPLVQYIKIGKAELNARARKK
ncbi:MAG: hypothetical protein A2268_09545 [Candidatus Raymondbacteria bacterium RifOxyA12_full_50_37]|uniref:Ion-translocating oxidoreductase complex subunit C n=1 Tax=Candidatus Raymondbacteria bacterium RIFOXYD12_FULL_49_13 TaxID=1817890 RepID=A0A1F7F1H1_UNCRA|nr:MAG: hypothetical protein A2268_09545 [Candidatus Raymondbacteria bacterium RifOxyA12_full_50_37]OGJ93916.1 MAG: hypothetical protein A2248_06750 [Candidatus Raymondbacteria bacterium RIFOXYA2_FULL_49_16]OGJ98215.1 MAG: hypothetical protein A2453_00415 [Candidatus Raymondbacteria bacterium RIFOXYC2_FULL_50_21]OGK00448.1 MAG: hypothetical protein A2519_10590 [Candidatus Raymondbacteria bacterium RIFOXYD12_FULL_49_13]OGK05170.1 MAG: hypothetical protein A2487_08210 [Candidatus Raymondbacteria 